METSKGYNSGIFKDRSKMFVARMKFLGSRNLKASSKFVSDWLLCYGGNQLMLLNTTLA